MLRLHYGVQIITVAGALAMAVAAPSRPESLTTYWRHTMNRKYGVAAGLVAGVALAVAAATYAQPSGGPGYDCGPEMGMGRGHGPMAGGDPAVMVESRMTELKAQLKITPAQDAAWQAYAAQARSQAASMQAMRGQMQEDTGSAPERMAKRTAAMQQQLAGMTRMTETLTALYAVLTPDQKAVADQNLGMMGGGGRPHGRRAG
jgi:Spy/CpxP family protein refolding chaperone